MTVARPVVRPRLPWWQVGLTVVLAAGGYFAPPPIRHELGIRGHPALPSPRLPTEPGTPPNKTTLHYADIHAVINDLWAAGAEAIAINGERIITRTGLNCVGTTILCNTKRIAPPYTIVAIGDPARLLAHLQRPAGPAEILRAFGFPLRPQGLERVTVPAYRGTTPVTLVRPAGGGP